MVNDIHIYGGFLGITPDLPDGETQRSQRNPEANTTVLSGTLIPDFSPPCGNPGAGSCLEAHLGGGCDDETCCETICAGLPTCCTVEWDSTCASLATPAPVVPVCETCGAPGSGSCFLEQTGPGCEDPEWCVQVCAQVPGCCSSVWSEACADAAVSLALSGQGAHSRHVVTADGGVAQIGQSARLSGFTITGGVADGGGIDNSGAGILVRNDSAPVITRCVLDTNLALWRGGGLAAFGSNPGPGIAQPALANCTIFNNRANVQGGGIALEFQGAALVVNSLFTSNLGLEHGGAIAAAGAGLSVYSSTFSSNIAITFGPSAGGAIWADSAGPVTITNSILWGDAVGEIFDEGDEVEVTYSDVQGGFPGTGNKDVNPQFAGPGDYHLTASSVECIDAGHNIPEVQHDDFDVNDNNNLGEYAPDLDLNLRIRQGAHDGCPAAGVVDMGAYEFDPCRADCAAGGPDGVVDVVDFLRLLQSWGEPCMFCDIEPPEGVDVVDFLALLMAWGPCGEPGGSIPQTVQDCMTCCGSDPLVISECICKVEPCTEGCPPEGCQ